MPGFVSTISNSNLYTKLSGLISKSMTFKPVPNTLSFPSSISFIVLYLLLLLSTFPISSQISNEKLSILFSSSSISPYVVFGLVRKLISPSENSYILSLTKIVVSWQKT